jgi:uncharacterized membrane protein
MTIAHALSAPAPSPRWLLLGSLALNLFFIGLTIALLVHEPAALDRSVSARIERLAATLPAPDADKLRTEFNASRTGVEGTRATYENARDNIRAVLRRDPFDPAAMSDAMAKTRAARQDFDLVLQGVVAKAAGEMSSAGRRKLADYSPPRGR